MLDDGGNIFLENILIIPVNQENYSPQNPELKPGTKTGTRLELFVNS